MRANDTQSLFKISEVVMIASAVEIHLAEGLRLL